MRGPFLLLLLRGLPGRWAGVVVSCCVLAGCASNAPTPRGEVKGSPTHAAEMAQSDANRVATLAMQENLEGLLRLADKLYRRNPAEWRKSTATSREQALEQLRTAVQQRQPWAPLQGRRDIAAMALALAPEFAGDRVAAFIHATADMIITAHGGKTEFFLLDGMDAQHFYNAARNVETAVWLLAQRRNAQGQPLLLADEIGAQGRNLSFEREFGKIIALPGHPSPAQPPGGLARRGRRGAAARDPRAHHPLPARAL